MKLSLWLKFNRPSARQTKPARSRFSVLPRLDLLEDRTVPSLSVGANVNITKLAGSQAESTISINPTSPANLFEIDTISRAGHFSTDGGATWANSNMGGLPASLGDVQTAWDSFGNLYLTFLTGTLTSPTKFVDVAISTNGGLSFANLTPTTPVSHSGSDQPSITVGPGHTPGTQSVWVSWEDAFSGLDTVKVAGAEATGLGLVGGFTTFTVPDAIGSGFGDVAVGSNGQVLVAYQSTNSGQGPDSIRINVDPDGLGPLGFQTNSTIATSTNVGGFDPISAQPSRSIDAEGNLAWDRSGGPLNGRVYLVFTDAPAVGSSDTNIFVRHSDDNGATWSAPVQVNDDATTNSQFLPAVAVDQTTGNVAVTWYDARNAGVSNTTVQVFGSVSTDGGAAFAPNVQISTGTTDATVGAAGTFNLGDYDKMDFRGGVFFRTWADNSNSTGDNPDGAPNGLDIYTAMVTLTVSNTAPVVTPPADQTATEGTGQLFDLGTFVDPDGGPWAVDVNWGDGAHTTFMATTAGTLGTQAHTYAEDGDLPVTVTVTDSTGLADAKTFRVLAAEPEIFVSGPVTHHGKKINNEAVATFTHANGTEPATAFLAMIDWGDGTPLTPGAITQSGTTYTVRGSHVYDKGGPPHTVTTTVTEIGESAGGAFAMFARSAPIAAPPPFATFSAAALRSGLPVREGIFADASIAEDTSSTSAHIPIRVEPLIAESVARDSVGVGDDGKASGNSSEPFHTVDESFGAFDVNDGLEDLPGNRLKVV